MRDSSLAILDEFFERHKCLKTCQSQIVAAVELLVRTFAQGGKLLICGNGGSAADAEHIVGELMKGFVLPRPLTRDLCERLRCNYPKTSDYLISQLQMALPAYSLVSQTAFLTAFTNDQGADAVFAQQVLGYGQRNDCLLGISTSGTSKNVIYAAQVAKTLDMSVIVLTGNRRGALVDCSDVAVEVPECSTERIQELHLPIYHLICRLLENEFFGEV